MSQMRPPVRVAVTGAAGQIGYALLPRIASGAMLGPEQPMILQMLEVPQAMGALAGVQMELEDCAFPLLRSVVASDDPEDAFADADYALLVGSRPRTAGMERADLLAANGAIFSAQGRALAARARPSVRVLVVGNPANTNALIAMRNASGLDPRRFSAMTRLDHNRALSQAAKALQADSHRLEQVIVWGNHSSTQYPDLHHLLMDGEPAFGRLDADWYANQFIGDIQGRGAAIIEARGASSAASAANAAIDHMRDWALGSRGWVSMAVLSDGNPYGIADGLMYSFPCTCSGGDWQIVPGLDINDFSRQRMESSAAELAAEREAVAELLP